MASPTKKSVELFYDVVSPYSWIAFEVLCRYRQKWNIDLKFKPFFLGGVMTAADNQPPGYVPRKGMYMQNDLKYLSKHYKIPLKFPENPGEAIFGRAVSLPAMRFLTALDATHPDYFESVSRKLWQRVWQQDQTIDKPENLVDAAKQAGLSDATISATISKISTSETKDLLKARTQEALDHGAFGAPTIIATDSSNKKHMVFGSDRMHILADLLDEKYGGPLVELASKI